jgi:hypothetical protein
MNILPRVEEAMRLHCDGSLPNSRIEKRRKCISAPKFHGGGAARSPADGADRIVFNSDRETVVSPGESHLNFWIETRTVLRFD